MDFSFEDAKTFAIAQRIHALSRDLEAVSKLQAPALRTIAQAPLLEDWHFGQRYEPCLVGRVEGHPERDDGVIMTSGVYLLDPVMGYARTLSRWYRLGTPRQ
nr:DUF6634 family protein [uncultured Devosia sp.]